MNRNIILVFILLLPLCLKAQQEKIDSLTTLLSGMEDDTNKVICLNRLGILLEFKEPGKAAKYLEDGLELAKLLNYKTGLFDSYIFSGYLEEDLGNYEKAAGFYELALFTAKESVRESPDNKRCRKNEAIGLMNMGNINNNLANYPKATVYYQEALRINESIGDE